MGEYVADTLSQVLTAQPDLNKVPPEARKLLWRCLDKDPKQRLRDIGDARFLVNEFVAAAPVPPLHSRLGSVGWIVAALMALVSIASVWSPWRPSRSTPVPTVRFTMDIAPAEMLGPAPFFARPVYTAMALSPDGSTVVFSGVRGSPAGPRTQLFRRALNQSDATAIAGTEGAAEPFFSPDGQWVGFFAGGKLKKVPINGGPASTVCDVDDKSVASWGGAWGANWGPTDTIFFALGRNGLMQVPASGGAPQAVLKPDSGKRESYATPELLPDGKTLLFTLRTAGSEPEIVARRLETGEQRTLIQGGMDPHYVPTGHLVYMQNAVLMAVPFDAGRAQLAGSPVAMLDGVMQTLNAPNGGVETGMGEFAISTAGHLVYAAGGVFPPRLVYLTRADRKGSETDLRLPKGQYVGARVAPDGKRVAVRKGGVTSDIWLVDIDSGSSTRLTSEGVNNWPVWSPDGKRIVFARPASEQLVAIAADGSGTVEPLLAAKSVVSAASWSADGKWLAYLESHDRLFQIWTAPMSGPGEPKRFAASNFSLGDAELSPDGRWMAYFSTESGAGEIYVQAFPGAGEKHKISTSGGINPAWARNGRELFYLEGAGTDKAAMMAVEFAAGGAFKAGAPRKLFEAKIDITTPLRSYDVTPDGRFLIARPEDPPDQRVTRLNVVLNWFEELKRRAPRSVR